MNRNELVRLLVLNAICDDYENVDQVILQSVVEDGAKCGLTIDRSEIVDALGGLVEDDLAKAHILSSAAPQVCWPLDDEGNLKPDWRLDPA